MYILKDINKDVLGFANTRSCVHFCIIHIMYVHVCIYKYIHQPKPHLLRGSRVDLLPNMAGTSNFSTNQYSLSPVWLELSEL